MPITSSREEFPFSFVEKREKVSFASLLTEKALKKEKTQVMEEMGRRLVVGHN